MKFHRLQGYSSVLLPLLLLSGCQGRNSVAIHVSRQQIQQQLASRFPIEKREMFFKAVFTLVSGKIRDFG